MKLLLFVSVLLVIGCTSNEEHSTDTAVADSVTAAPVEAPNAEFSRWENTFNAANASEKQEMYTELLQQTEKPLACIDKYTFPADYGVLYLGNHKHVNINFTIIGKKRGEPVIEHITTGEPRFLQGYNYGPKESLLVLYRGQYFKAQPFWGLAAFVAW
jgi:hypothetical protein